MLCTVLLLGTDVPPDAAEQRRLEVLLLALARRTTEPEGPADLDEEEDVNLGGCPLRVEPHVLAAAIDDDAMAFASAGLALCCACPG